MRSAYLEREESPLQGEGLARRGARTPSPQREEHEWEDRSEFVTRGPLPPSCWAVIDRAALLTRASRPCGHSDSDGEPG